MIDTGSETRIAGRWTLGRLELRITREFKQWIQERLADPLNKEIFEFLPRDEQLARVKEQERITKDLKCFSLNSGLAREYLQTEEGAAKFLQLLLQRHHPDITEEEAFDVFMAYPQEVAAALDRAQGQSLGNPPKPAA